MKSLIIIIILIASILAQNTTTNTTETSSSLDPWMLAENGMTLLILFMTGHMYKRKFGITSSCEGPPGNKTIKFAMQSSGSEL